MAEQRTIVPVRLFDVRLVSTRSLWVADTMFQGKKMESPQYKVTLLVKKSDPNARGVAGRKEPIFAPLVDGCRKVYAAHMNGAPMDSIKWPARDGNRPNT